MKKRKIIRGRGLYTWTCPYCGYTLEERYDDPSICYNCGR